MMTSGWQVNVLGMVEVLGQRLELHDLALVALLVVLEGVLSIDNALVLGLLAKRLPKHQQSKALTYGLVGAFVFRFIAIGLAAYLIYWRVVKLLGGAYLAYVSLKHFVFERHREEHEEEKVVVGPSGDPELVSKQTGAPLPPDREEEELAERTTIPALAEPEPATGSGRVRRKQGFWATVAVIELTDIAFAVDSILAAIALVGSAPAGEHHRLHPKMWVVVTGGMLGVILMRFAAVVFIRLLEKFPRFETSAYLLVFVIGGKLLVDWGFNSPEHPHRVDFHSYQNPAFWIFWGLMLACFMVGFIPQKKKH